MAVDGRVFVEELFYIFLIFGTFGVAFDPLVAGSNPARPIKFVE